MQGPAISEKNLESLSRTWALNPKPVEAGKVCSSPAQFEFKSIGNQVTPMIKITRAETGTRPGGKGRA